MDETTRRRLQLAVHVLLRGFLAFLILLALLAVFTPVICLHSPGKARVVAARHDLAQIASALDLFRLDAGRYPTTEEGLAVLAAPTPELQAEGKYRKGGYLDRPPEDPWGNPYRYKRPGCHNHGGYDLWSNGADNAPGGEGENADIANWDEPADWSARPRRLLVALAGAITGFVIGLPFYVGVVILRRAGGKSPRQSLTGLHLAALVYMTSIGVLIVAFTATGVY